MTLYGGPKFEEEAKEVLVAHLGVVLVALLM